MRYLLLIVVPVYAADVLLPFVLREVYVLEREVGPVLRDDEILARLGQIEASELVIPDRLEGCKA